MQLNYFSSEALVDRTKRNENPKREQKESAVHANLCCRSKTYQITLDEFALSFKAPMENSPSSLERRDCKYDLPVETVGIKSK
jgi:hypothetical protein